MKPVVIIPAYKPEAILIELVKTLTTHQHEVVVVNDGSPASYDAIFNQLADSNVHVLKHGVNLGKGQALKTAFNFVLVHYPPTLSGVVTADADGQHLVQDILNVSNHLCSDPKGLWLGARTFKGSIPFRSKIGNNLTRFIFRLLIGQSLTDTQTGLRGIPRTFLEKLLRTPSNGYDFELDMLILASQNSIKMRETEIQTVYKDNNKSSHFNPVIDSFKIYFVFFRYMFFSIISGLLDFIAFSFAYSISHHIFWSESLARIFSGTCNFIFNKELVFKSKNRIIPEACKYASLCLLNLVFSYALIRSLTYIGLSVYASKMMALIALFFANFAIQKMLVFNRHEERETYAS